MRPAALLLVIPLALVTACTSSGGVTPSVPGSDPATTSTTAAPTTTALDISRACAVLGSEAVAWLEDLVSVLDGVPAGDVVAGAWPDDLTALVARGDEFDVLAAELGCDPGTIQAGVLQEAARMQAEGRTGAMLLDLLGAISGRG